MLKFKKFFRKFFMVLYLSFQKTIKSEDGPRHDIHQVSRGCTTSDDPDSCTLQVNSNGTVQEKHCHHTCLALVQHASCYMLS